MKVVSFILGFFALCMASSLFAKEHDNNIKSIDVKVEREIDCFSGPTENWMSWREKLARNKNEMDNFEKYNPKAVFDKFKATLDCEVILYSVDGVKVFGYAIKPKNSKGKLPVVIYNRGGHNRPDGSKFGGLVFMSVLKQLMPIAEQGYVVMASNYRRNDEFGGADIDDVKALLEIAKMEPAADLKRIASVGTSRGVMMNYLLAKKGVHLKAIVSIAGPHDVMSALKKRPEMEHVYEGLVPNYALNKFEEQKKRSVLSWLEKLDSETAILLIHGKKDLNVDYQQSLLMVDALVKRKQKHKLVSFEDADHFLFREHSDEVIKETTLWLKTYL